MSLPGYVRLLAKRTPGQAVWWGDKGGSIGSCDVQGLGWSSGEDFLGAAASDKDALVGLRGAEMA